MPVARGANARKMDMELCRRRIVSDVLASGVVFRLGRAGAGGTGAHVFLIAASVVRVSALPLPEGVPKSTPYDVFIQ